MRRRTKRKATKLGFYLLLALLLACALYYIRYNSNIHTPIDNENAETISFQIKKGESVKAIGEKLEEIGLTKNAFHFYLYSKFNHKDRDILSGRFELRKNMNVPEIISTISDASQAESVITIQEGLTIKDIDAKLVDLELINEGEFVAAVKSFDNWSEYSFLDPTHLKTLIIPLEGYIYPDTYFLDGANFEPEDLIYLGLDNFKNKFSELQEKIKRHSINEIITMASIIENEVISEQDRKTVSGILWKRLESGWMLGADATLLYLAHDREITASDLAADSPYNTRKNAGLPPGPICNPSISSIEAAMYPQESEYWFYLTTLDTGEVIYSKTNEEHNANRGKYL